LPLQSDLGDSFDSFIAMFARMSISSRGELTIDILTAVRSDEISPERTGIHGLSSTIAPGKHNVNYVCDLAFQNQLITRMDSTADQVFNANCSEVISDVYHKVCANTLFRRNWSDDNVAQFSDLKKFYERFGIVHIFNFLLRYRIKERKKIMFCE
jgi:hypothetical protein